MRLQSLLRRRPSPALAISLVALFVSLGGVGYAAVSIPNNSVGTAQLRHGAVTNSKIRSQAVTFGKIRPGSVGHVRANLTQIQARVSGTCAVGTAIGAIDQTGGKPTCNSTLPPAQGTTDNTDRVGGSAVTVNSISLAAGSYIAFANPSATVTSSATAERVVVNCRLTVGGNTQNRRVTIRTSGTAGDTSTASMALQQTGPSGPASVSCTSAGPSGAAAPDVSVTSKLNVLRVDGNS